MISTVRQRILLAAIFLSVALLGAPPVFAHANLVRSEPAANSANPSPPTRVILWFSEEVEPRFTTITVLDKLGVQLDQRDSQRVSDDAKAMQVSLFDLPQGLYTVVWKALSAVDGHVTTGSFSFTVGDVPLSDSSPREIMSLVDNALIASSPPSTFEITVRILNLFLLIALAGGLAFPLLVLFPASRISSLQSPASNFLRVYLRAVTEKNHPSAADEFLSKHWFKFMRAVIVLYALATVAVLISQTLVTGEGLDAIPRVLTGTRFGAVWLFRVVILAALGVMIFRKRTRGATLLGIALVLSQSLTSHGAAVNDPPILPLLTDFVHLLGTAIWVGGLVQLLLTNYFLNSLPQSQKNRALSSLIRCFSLVAFVSVGIILASGAYSMFVQVASLEAFSETLYGATLFVKFIFVLPLLALGAFNLIVTRLALARQFNRAVVAEIIFAVAVIAAVGFMTSIAPAKSAYDPSPKLIVQTKTEDDLLITLGIAPGLVGTNDFDAKVQDTARQSVSNATVVRILGGMREMDMGVQEVALTPQGDGHYTLHADMLSMIGIWQMEVLVRRDDRYDTRTTFEIPAIPSRAISSSQFAALAQSESWVGLAITLLAFASGTAVVLIGKVNQRVRWRTLAGAILISALGALLVFQTTTRVAQIVTVPIAPPSARTLRSPVRADAATLAVGSQIYAQNCAVCHGNSGKGDGPSAAVLNPKPVDLTIHSRLHAEGELYWWVTNGIAGTAMPPWQSSLNDLQRWQVVMYIRTLGLSPATVTP